MTGGVDRSRVTANDHPTTAASVKGDRGASGHRAGYDAAREFTAAANGVQGTRYVPVSGIRDDAYASIGQQSYVLSAARGGRAI
jgi:hypothetical protein